MTIGKKKLQGKIENLNYEADWQQESVWCKCLKMNGEIECGSGCWQWG